MWKAQRLTSLLAVAVIMMECATREPYPETWPALEEVRAGECADISGTFANACATLTSRDSDCLDAGGLAGLLLGKYAGSFHTKYSVADRVVISQHVPLELRVTVWDEEELVDQGEIQLQPENCTAEGIVIGSGLKGTQIEGGIGTGSSRAVLSKSEDGDLIANTKVKFTGVWFVVPVSGSTQGWDLYERLPDFEEADP